LRSAGHLTVRSDIGAYGRKRPLLDTANWCLEGTPGAEIHPAVAPAPGDHVFVKKKPSAFFGTPLTAMLIQLGTHLRPGRASTSA
jgi:maleamate amidohydrolase